ncbi:MAG: hypothetical protein J7L47_02130 [Candidatus Odinarchaeota archaeon]|nr:hypothetical protein [Candidatus Odinarchaeota archaeon]
MKNKSKKIYNQIKVRVILFSDDRLSKNNIERLVKTTLFLFKQYKAKQVFAHKTSYSEKQARQILSKKIPVSRDLFEFTIDKNNSKLFKMYIDVGVSLFHYLLKVNYADKYDPERNLSNIYDPRYYLPVLIAASMILKLNLVKKD